MRWIQSNIRQRYDKKDLQFDIKLDPKPFTPLPFYEAASVAIKKMADDYGHLWLSLSGGMDSEFVLKVGIENKVPITPVIVRTAGNAKEILWALRFCKDINVKPVVLHISDQEMIALWFKHIYYPIWGRGFNWGPTLKVIEHAKKHGGWVVTGDCPPTSDNHIDYLDVPLSNELHLAEWDFYATDLFDQPGSLFTYTEQCFYGFTKEVDLNLSTQRAKAKLYDVEVRYKMRAEHSAVVNSLMGIFHTKNPTTPYKILGKMSTFNKYMEMFIDEKTSTQIQQL
jgi:hypothetical protein